MVKINFLSKNIPIEPSLVHYVDIWLIFDAQYSQGWYWREFILPNFTENLKSYWEQYA